jgi:thiol-disulfide isomerase/thioredoxin
LKKLANALDSVPKAKELKGFIAFRTILAEHAVEIVKPDANVQSLEEAHIEKLKAFVQDYPGADDSIEAMVLLGLSSELAGVSADAESWYRKAAAANPESPQAKKAAGAVNRLNLVGQSLRLTGNTLDGKKFDSRDFAKKPIVVHYWASWCEPCKNDMVKLRALQAKHAKEGLTIVGINVDDAPERAIASLKSAKNTIPWSHIYEPGGLENKLSTDLGVFSLPVTFLIDGSGKVVMSGTHYSSELESSVQQLLQAPAPKNANQPAPRKR